MTANFATFDIFKYNEALSRGLCIGEGSPDGQMCIEAAVCYAFGLPHDDDPKCVAEAIRCFKIQLNDNKWSSPRSRSEGLYKLGLAQLGSKGVVQDAIFAEKLVLATTNNLLPKIFRETFIESSLKLGLQVDAVSILQDCKKATINDAARALKAAVDYSKIMDQNRFSAVKNFALNCFQAVHWLDKPDYAAGQIANAVNHLNSDKYLKMTADLALEILIELDSPGCQFLK